MKERDILFKAEMVRAILADRKTQTRRLCKDQAATSYRYVENSPVFPERWNGKEGQPYTGWVAAHEGLPLLLPRPCPKGAAGDKLWVRETWRAPQSWDHTKPSLIPDSEGIGFVADEYDGAPAGFGRTRVSIHMPRWASRITLEITGIRVERLNDILTRDCIKEGYPTESIESHWSEEVLEAVRQLPQEKRKLALATAPRLERTSPSPREWYRALWENINGPESWNSNPWVWVIDFKRVHA
jgi:hypothetical protein